MEKKTQFSIWYFIWAFLILIFLQRFFFMPHIQHVTYSEFRKLVQEKRVNDLVISSNIIHGKLEKGAGDTIFSSLWP